jgi:HEAT repeat protein
MGEYRGGGFTHPTTRRLNPDRNISQHNNYFNGMNMVGVSDLLDELSCGDDERAEAALSHLTAWGPEVVEPLRERLSNPEAEVRWWAVRALAEVIDERVPELLVSTLTDPDKGVRWCAGLALRRHPSEKAAPALMNMLSEEDALTRRLAGDALVAIGSQVVPQLLETVQKGEHVARLEAVRALAKIGDERSIPTLFEALDDDSALIEYWASEGLEKMGVGMVVYKPE